MKTNLPPPISLLHALVFLLLAPCSLLQAQVVVQSPGIRAILAGPGITVNTNGFTRTISAQGAGGGITDVNVSGDMMSVGGTSGAVTITGPSTNSVRTAVAAVTINPVGGLFTDITYSGTGLRPDMTLGRSIISGDDDEYVGIFWESPVGVFGGIRFEPQNTGSIWAYENESWSRLISSASLSYYGGLLFAPLSTVTNLNASALTSGTIPDARLPQFTGGDVTSPSAGSAVLNLGDGTVTPAKTTITGAPDGTKYLRDDWTWQAVAGGGLGGSTGGTDNMILRADGAGGSTVQNSVLKLHDISTSTQRNLTIENTDGSNAATVIDTAGTGAFILGNKPDGTVTGGNARGARAVDLQLGRTNAAQVAAGIDSFAAGANNTTAGPTSVALGYANAARSSHSFIGSYAMGQGNSTGSGSIGAYLVGTANITGNYYYAAAFGSNNTVNGHNSLALGSRATVSHDGSVVVGANADQAVSSDRTKQFKIRADGGITHQTDGGTRTDYGKRSSAPGSPVSGDRYYDTSTNKERVYNGSTWNDCW